MLAHHVQRSRHAHLRSPFVILKPSLRICSREKEAKKKVPEKPISGTYSQNKGNDISKNHYICIMLQQWRQGPIVVRRRTYRPPLAVKTLRGVDFFRNDV